MIDPKLQEALHEYIVSEIKTKRPDLADKSEIVAGMIVTQPFMRSQDCVEAFLASYLAHHSNP